VPKIGTRLKTDFVMGMGKKEEQFVIILDIDKVLSSGDVPEIRPMEAEDEVQMAGKTIST
jgi:purine-binding chemotaxis protein CheW